MTYEESMHWRSGLADADDVEAEALREDEMAKSTPGPWHATTRKGSWDWVVARDSNNEICQMFHDGTDFNETGEANARLIAAAPELLEEMRNAAANLETIMDLIDGYVDVKYGDYGEPEANDAMRAKQCAEIALNGLQKAIRKAEAA